MQGYVVNGDYYDRFCFIRRIMVVGDEEDDHIQQLVGEELYRRVAGGENLSVRLLEGIANEYGLH